MSTEKYRQAYIDRLESHLTVPYTKDDNFDLSAFVAAADLNELFLKSLQEPERSIYVGCAHFGSRARGFPVKGSDVDIVVFLDKEKLLRMKGTPDFKDPLIDIRNLEHELRMASQSIKSNGAISPIFCRLDFANPFEVAEPWLFHLIFGQTVIGTRVEEFKRRYADAVLLLPKRAQKHHIAKLVNVAIEAEESRLPKMQERMGISDTEARAVLKKRRVMWGEQIRQAVGLSKTKTIER